jgi:hypothetical protein
MKARFGRDIFCQVCLKDDCIELEWYGKFTYHYVCTRCNRVVKERDHTGKALPVQKTLEGGSI